MENFIEELKKVLDIMHNVDTERVRLFAYELKYVVRTWLDQWMKANVEGGLLRVGNILRRPCRGISSLINCKRLLYESSSCLK